MQFNVKFFYFRYVFLLLDSNNIYSSSCLYLLSSSSVANGLAMCRLGGVITTQIVLFYTLINTGFEHFLYNNRPN